MLRYYLVAEIVDITVIVSCFRSLMVGSRLSELSCNYPIRNTIFKSSFWDIQLKNNIHKSLPKAWVHTNLPQAGFELSSLRPKTGVLPIQPPLLVLCMLFGSWFIFNLNLLSYIFCTNQKLEFDLTNLFSQNPSEKKERQIYHAG